MMITVIQSHTKAKLTYPDIFLVDR